MIFVSFSFFSFSPNDNDDDYGYQVVWTHTFSNYSLHGKAAAAAIENFPFNERKFSFSIWREKHARCTSESIVSLSLQFSFSSHSSFSSLSLINRLQRRLRRRWLKTFFSTMKIVVVCRWYPSEKNRNNSIKPKVHFYVPPMTLSMCWRKIERARAKILKFISSSSADMRDDVKCKERKEVYWRKRRRCCYKYQWVVYSHT